MYQGSGHQQSHVSALNVDKAGWATGLARQAPSANGRRSHRAKVSFWFPVCDMQGERRAGGLAKKDHVGTCVRTKSRATPSCRVVDASETYGIVRHTAIDLNSQWRSQFMAPGAMPVDLPTGKLVLPSTGNEFDLLVCAKDHLPIGKRLGQRLGSGVSHVISMTYRA